MLTPRENPLYGKKILREGSTNDTLPDKHITPSFIRHPVILIKLYFPPSDKCDLFISTGPYNSRQIDLL